MLQAGSPTKVSVWPASVPRCSRMVSRSASAWQGWNWSVSALTTGTPAYAAISSSRDCSWVRHTMAEAWRPSTRAVSAIDSRTPTWASEPSMIIGKPPSSAMPEANDAWVRRVGLSKSTATVRGPASGRSSYGLALSFSGEVEHRRLLLRGEVVVAQEVAGHG